MSYEEKYKEALKIMESLHSVVKHQSSSDALLASQTIEKAFPELRESEDERIRKEIIELVQFYYGSSLGRKHTVSKDDMVAWLEKQDKQKRTPKYKIGDCIKYRGEEYKITNVTVTDNNFYYDVSLIKEPSDYGEVVAAIGMAAEEKMFKIEQEPSWSEENEDALDIAIRIIQNGGDDCAGILDSNKALRWLKSIKDRVQPKQEWSEGDKKMINLLIKIFEVNHTNEHFKVNPIGTTNMEAVSTKEIVDWLKSIKPNHWKPSEEQMEALRNLLSGSFSMDNSKTYQSIDSLYNDIKKL